VPKSIESADDELKQRAFAHAVGLEGAAAQPIARTATPTWRHLWRAVAVVLALGVLVELVTYAWPLSETERAELFIYATATPVLLVECANPKTGREWQARALLAAARAAHFLQQARDRTATPEWEAQIQRNFPHVPDYDDRRWLGVCSGLLEAFDSDRAATRTLESRFSRHFRKLGLYIPPRR
jgi:hypothetical protein